FWGAYHGFFLVIERVFFGKVLEKIGKLPALLITFFIVNIGWVFFRLENIGTAFSFIGRMFSSGRNYNFMFEYDFKVYMVIAAFFSFFAASRLTEKLQAKVYFNEYTNLRHLVMCFACMALFVLSVCSVTTSAFNPFIYFRF